MNAVPFAAFRKTTNALYTLRERDAEYFVKCYCGPGRPQRKEREQQMLRLWGEEGFPVPHVYDLEFENLPKPHLVTSLVQGISLRECLITDTHPIGAKMELLASLFETLRRRHDLAITRNDPRLVHPDPNTGNIICTASGLCFIDFEAPPRRRNSVTEAASIEVATLSRWAVRDLGEGRLSQVLERAVAAYKGREPLLDLIVGRTMDRPFQLYHRWRDGTRKRRNPGEVTKYDIAEALASIRECCASSGDGAHS